MSLTEHADIGQMHMYRNISQVTRLAGHRLRRYVPQVISQISRQIETQDPEYTSCIIGFIAHTCSNDIYNKMTRD